MTIKEIFWPWGALADAKKHVGELEAALQTKTFDHEDAMAFRRERDTARALAHTYREDVAKQHLLLASAYFRDPNTGRFLDRGVLPPPKKEVINA